MKRLSITRNRKEYDVKNLKYDYDKVNDLLFLYKEGVSVYSTVIIGEFHLEFSKEGNLVGVEILNASDLLKEYNIPQKFLENIKSAALKVVIRNNLLLVYVILKALDQEKRATITMNEPGSPIMQVIKAR